METQELVTVGTYADYIQANLARLRLDTEGIEAVIEDHYFIGMEPLHDIAVGGVKLRVLAGDREEALRILQAQREALAALPLHCPRCDSTEVVRGFHFVLLGLALFFIPLGGPRRRIYCKACKHAWREP